MMRTAVAIATLLIVHASATAAQPKEKPMQPLCVSGVYPHLAVFNGRYDPQTDNWHGTGGECGIGAVVPWAGKLWVVTYPPHEVRGGKDKLWTIDKNLKQEMRPESVGGTHAGRMIHRESNQLIIGPYFVDAQGRVRACDVKTKLVGRMTAIARHLADPANRVYFFDMEGAIYEVDVHSLAVKELFAKPVPGWHGKGGYTGQGRLIIANNGEHGPAAALKHLLVGGPAKHPDDIGCLAEWDGTTWRIIERKQFLDVTGPGGIHGAPDDKAPVWSIGWDRRSCILKLRDAGQWRTFRLPKASHAFDPAHGWYTEWPRIREVGGGNWLMCLHGMLYRFPPGFRTGHTAGIRPIASHLRYIPDFCDWDGRLVLAADEASVMANPMCGKSQSNLWFGTLADLPRFGPRTGWGGPWVADTVKAGDPSDPYLIGGFAHRCLHLALGGRRPAARVHRTSGRFNVTTLPDKLAALPRVSIARGDYHKPAPGFAFSVNLPVTAYIAVDQRGDPTLDDGWRKTNMHMEWEGRYADVVYAKAFEPGRVAVPGRTKPHNAAGHYAVPNLCFLQATDAGTLAVTELPKALGAQFVQPVEQPAATPAAGEVTFAIEIDPDGSGTWAPYKQLAVPPGGYVHHLLPPDLKAEWLRVRPDKACVATAYLHATAPRTATDGEDALFDGLAPAARATSWCSGLVRPAAHNTYLQFVAQTVDAEGKVADAGYWEVDKTLAFRRTQPNRSAEVREVCAIKPQFTVDDASVIMAYKGTRYRLPKGDAANDKPFATGWPRCVREVQSERFLVNVHGSFYEMPRDTRVPHIKPVSTHNRAIVDFCSWRGLLVLSGTRLGARPDGNHFASPDSAVSLWFGAVDDLWRFGKPVGRGGPWRNTAVAAGRPSDPYLMTGYDRKTLELSHDADAPVTVTVEVDFDHSGAWRRHAALTVPAGQTLRHAFPAGYSAHWARLTPDRACTATATFIYE